MSEDKMTFHQCCLAVLNSCPDMYAKAYANVGLEMTDQREIEFQALYILNNMSRWRGELATKVRIALKGFGGER